MKNNNLFLYVIISLLIHLLIFIAFPLADKAGVASDNNDSGDFGFIQMIEYQPITQTSQQAGENENAYEESAKTESPVNDDKEDEEVKIDNEDEIEDNNTTTNDGQNINEQNNKSNENLENINKNQEIGDNNIEDEVVKDNKSESNKDQVETESNENKKEVMTSENSDVEMNVEESKEKDTSTTSETKTNESGNDKSSKKEKEEPPPPPPTSGELIANSVTPQYPKDLIGEGKRGTVEFIVNINKSGNINKLTMTNSSEIDQMDRTARLAIERGWEFKSYNLDYSIPIIVTFSLNEEGNPRIDVILGEVDFKEVAN